MCMRPLITVILTYLNTFGVTTYALLSRNPPTVSTGNKISNTSFLELRPLQNRPTMYAFYYCFQRGKTVLQNRTFRFQTKYTSDTF